MKITKLILKGYKRLHVSHIDYLEYTPGCNVQIIAGTNGCGKTSLMEQLSPLPANKKHFTDDGYKEIHITHKGFAYVIKSDFGSTTPHTFTVDAQELNETGSIMTQRELVKKHFNIDQRVFDIMLGKSGITHSTPVSRRELFIEICHMDLEYITALYEKAKDKHRDALGAHKVLLNRLTLEKQKVLSESDLKALRSDVKALHELLDALQGKRSPLKRPVGEYSKIIKNAQDDIHSFVFDAKDLLTKFRGIYLRDNHDDLKAKKYALENKRNDLKVKSEDIYRRFKLHDDKYKIAKAAFDKNIQNAHDNINTLEQQKEQEKAKKVFTFSTENPRRVLDTVMDELSNVLMEIIPEIRPDPDEHYTKQSYSEKSAQLKTLQAKRFDIKESISHHQGILRHYDSIKEGGSTECPNCKHKWIKGYDVEKVEETHAKLEKINTELSKVDKNIENLTETLAGIEKQRELYSQYIHVCHNYPQISGFWSYIKENKILRQRPQYVITLLKHLRSDLETDVKIQSIDKELTKCLEMSKHEPDIDFAMIVHERGRLEDESINLEKEIKRVDKEFTEINTLCSFLNRASYIKQTFEDKFARYTEITNDFKEDVYRDSILSLISEVHSALGSKEKALRDHEMQARLIDDLQSQISDLTALRDVYGVLSSELSPITGIVAEDLARYIEAFLVEMNKIIESVWCYPMTLSLENSEMGKSRSFNISVDVGVPVMQVNDISNGSDSMKEIIDLAFRICVLKAMGFYDYPIFLDEFGRTMDSTHKAATVGLMDKIMESDNFSQLFVISHDPVQYGAMANTELMVLSNTNLHLPKGIIYNTHITTQ